MPIHRAADRPVPFRPKQASFRGAAARQSPAPAGLVRVSQAPRDNITRHVEQNPFTTHDAQEQQQQYWDRMGKSEEWGKQGAEPRALMNDVLEVAEAAINSTNATQIAITQAGNLYLGRALRGMLEAQGLGPHAAHIDVTAPATDLETLRGGVKNYTNHPTVDAIQTANDAYLDLLDGAMSARNATPAMPSMDHQHAE